MRSKGRSWLRLGGVFLAVFMVGALTIRARAEEPKSDNGADGKEGAPAKSGIRGGEEKVTPPVIHLKSDIPGLKVDLNAAIHLDYLGFDPEAEKIKDAGSQENDFMLRRARFIMKGNLWENYSFYLQAGFEVTPNPFLDAVVTIPVNDNTQLRAGLMKLPFSEERLKSYLHQPVMERSLAANLELRRSQGVTLATNPGAGALSLYLGAFTGETMQNPNTDDDFEYVGRASVKLDALFESLPGKSSLGASLARGRRSPERSETTSFAGKTMNNFVFFAGVPVNGYRTRYEADWEWRYRSIWLAAEYIGSEEERNGVTVGLDTDGDGASDDSVTGDLDPLRERGWMVYFVWVLTGENAEEFITPKRSWGALELVGRYSELSFDTQEGLIPGSAAGTYGREVNSLSETLGRESVDETARELYVGLNWELKRGIFFQFATVWMWFDESSPYLDDRTSTTNYRARIGIAI